MATMTTLLDNAWLSSITSDFISKALDTIGKCLRPVFSLGESKNMHKTAYLLKLDSKWSSKLRENNDSKNTLVAQVMCLEFETSAGVSC